MISVACVLAAGAFLAGCASGVDRGAGFVGQDPNRPSDAAAGDAAVVGEDAPTWSPADAATLPDAAPLDAHVPDAAVDPEPDAEVPPEPDAAVVDPAPCAPKTSNLALSEVMVASVAGGGDRGEWFEVRNTGACPVDLAGLEIVSPTGSGIEKKHTVSGGIVAPGAYFVFALSGDAGENHAVPYDYVYGLGTADDVILNNAADWLELRVAGVAIDRVTWPSSGYVVGASHFYASSLDPLLNDNWAAWTASSAVYSTTGGTFRGTPGAP